MANGGSAYEAAFKSLRDTLGPKKTKPKPKEKPKKKKKKGWALVDALAAHSGGSKAAVMGKRR